MKTQPSRLSTLVVAAYAYGILSPGSLILIAMIGLAIVGPIIYSVNPYALGISTLHAPSMGHPMGTDELGRDLFAEFMVGIKTSIYVAVTASAIALCIGIVIGAIAGFYSGRVDGVVMFVTDFFQMVPSLILALVIVILIGPTIPTVIVIIGITSWPVIARVVRAQYFSYSQQEFVEAARASNLSDLRIIFSEILPNALGPVIVNASFVAANAVLIEAALSFLGAGDPNADSLGLLLNRAVPYIQTAWWLSVFPGIGVFLLVLGFNLLGDSLAERFNPRQPIKI